MSYLIMIVRNKVIVWNCKGAANKVFHRYYNQYVTLNKSEVFVVMESRCDPTKSDSTFKRMDLISVYHWRIMDLQVL